MKVSLFGDSILQSCDGNLTWYYGTRGHQVADRYFMGGTSACDWFDAAQAVHGDISVVCFNGNMMTPCTQARGWQLEVFAHDVEHLAAILTFTGKPVLWCAGPGGVGDLEVHNWRASIVYEVAKRYGQRYDNSARVLTQRAIDGAPYFEKWMPCEQDDIDKGWCFMGAVNVREADNYHLTPSGQRRFGQHIVNVT